MQSKISYNSIKRLATLWPSSIPREEFYVFRKVGTNCYFTAAIKNQDDTVTVFVTNDIMKCMWFPNLPNNREDLQKLFDSLNELKVSGDETFQFVIEKYRFDTISSLILEGIN